MTELPQFDIEKFRQVLCELKSVDIRYCEVSQAGEESEEALANLTGTTYSEILSGSQASRDSQNPLTKGPLLFARYRFAGTRELLEIESVFPGVRAARSLSYALGEQGGMQLLNEIDGKPVNTFQIISRQEYFSARQLYRDPTVLFLRFYLHSTRLFYFDMIDCRPTSVEYLGNRIILQSRFILDLADEEPIMQVRPNAGDVYRCEMQLDANSLLPRFVRFGPVSQATEWYMEVLEYFEQEGVHFPAKGILRLFMNKQLQAISLFVVDRESARLNIPLSEAELTIKAAPETIMNSN